MLIRCDSSWIEVLPEKPPVLPPPLAVGHHPRIRFLADAAKSPVQRDHTKGYEAIYDSQLYHMSARFVRRDGGALVEELEDGLRAP